MRICTSLDYSVEGQSRRNEGMTGYEPKHVCANYMVTICNQFNTGLVALLLLTIIAISSIMRDMHESITISNCESTTSTFVRSDHSCDSSLEQRFTTFNECLCPNAKSRLCFEGHCSDFDHKFRPVLHHFYAVWYMVPT